MVGGVAVAKMVSSDDEGPCTGSERTLATGTGTKALAMREAWAQRRHQRYKNAEACAQIVGVDPKHKMLG